MIVAGEDSGDAHAGDLVKAMRLELSGSDIDFFGAAGARMREQGVRSVVDSDAFGIVGVPEVLRAVPKFLRILKKLTKAAEEESPDIAILVDFPEFNLKLAKRLKKKGIRVVYYISPQLWAWREYRIRTIRDSVDLLVTILPFEQEWYKSRGVNHTVYAGNPLAGKVTCSMTRADFRKKHGIGEDADLIALLPGSRGKEIEMTFPVMLRAAELVKAERPNARFAVVLAKSRKKEEIEKFIDCESEELRNSIEIFEDVRHSVLNASEAAVVTSGTATLETALIGTPQVIVYRTSFLNYLLLKPLVNVGNFGLANLIAGRRVYKELLQNDFTAESLSRELLRLLEPDVNKALREDAKEIRRLLGKEDGAARAAAYIIKFAGF